MLVCGPSSSGKTEFILQLINERDFLFDKEPSAVYWFHGTRTARHDDLIESDFILSDTIPSSFDKLYLDSIIVLDDMMETAKNMHAVTRLFTQLAHHRNYFVIFSTQNMFQKSAEARTRSLNSQYMVLFKNPRDMGQIKTLGAQMYPNKANFLEKAYKDATFDSHAYLLIDLHQDTSELIRLPSHILPGERPMWSYVDKRLKNDAGCLF